MVYGDVRSIRAVIYHDCGGDIRLVRDDLESRHDDAIDAGLRWRARGVVFKQLGLYQVVRTREPSHGPVVSRCREDAIVPKSADGYCHDLSHSAHASGAGDKDE